MGDGIWLDPYKLDIATPLPRRPDGGKEAALGVWLAGNQKRGAVMVCPGGGYENLADHEGAPFAEFFNKQGIHAFVMRYRHSPHVRHPVPLEDARRGMRAIRHGAKMGWWNVDPGKIAVMGFSAGGHLAATLATDEAGWEGSGDEVGRQSARPDAQILAYPVIFMSRQSAHQGSRKKLLGEDASKELMESLDGDRRVSARTPPAFLFHTAEDPVVPLANSLEYTAALAQCGVSVDLHVFQPGSHGVGLASNHPDLAVWMDLLAKWLKRLGY